MSDHTETRSGGHEPGGERLSLVLLIGGLLVAITALSVVVAVVALGGDPSDPVAEPSAGDFARDVRGPRLQPDPGRELRELRAAERRTLRSYGWIDTEAGIVRVPIERAMELFVQRQRKEEGR